ncbi:MAG: 50S ribosomal protein L29 [Nanoarchaeota archaeon]|nr:50S ribosomal protein L29 [Nanoarchaeota archaeon]
MKFKEIKNLNKEQREKRLKELKLELVKSKVNVSKTGSAKVKAIKKIIARILTLNNQDKLGIEKK